MPLKSRKQLTRMIAGERSYRNRYSATHLGVLEDPQRIDEDGVLGEQAFAEAFGISPTAIERRRRVEQNFILADGTRVDVRASRARGACLIVPPSIATRESIDVYVLAQIAKESDRVRLVGWATAEEVRAADVRKISRRRGATAVHILLPGQLRDMAELERRNGWHSRRLLE